MRSCLLLLLTVLQVGSSSSDIATSAGFSSPSTNNNNINNNNVSTLKKQSQDVIMVNKTTIILPVQDDQGYDTPKIQSRYLELEQAADENGICDIPINYDPSVHKPVYTVGVLGIRGLEDAFLEWNATFDKYLNSIIPRRFNDTSAVRFQMKYLDFVSLFKDAESGEVDFIYVNPSAYSCIESEYEAYSLVSQVSRRKVNGTVFELKKFGGVIATLANRTDINSIHDLEDKIIAAASISGLGSGQLQFKEMIDAGMNYLQDPKQLVFTSDQDAVVRGLLTGDFDVGFVRTDQLERSLDINLNPIDLSLFKILEPKPGLNIDGVPFPFQSSTELYAEWNIAALTHVATDVSRQVQKAMLQVADNAKVGQALIACYAEQKLQEDAALAQAMDAIFNGTNITNPIVPIDCDGMSLQELVGGPVQCGTTKEAALAAVEATTAGKYAGWTTSLSYMPLRSMQQAVGFISEEPETNIWRCVRSEELYEAITCPAGFDKLSRVEVSVGCEEQGLVCKDGFQCVCRPCEIPYQLVCLNSIEINDTCISLAVFLPSIIIPILLVVAFFVHLYVEFKRSQADSVWMVYPSEIVFDTPPTIVGQGTFGLVLLADYRGTTVAVKRVIPPSSSKQNSLFDASTTYCVGDDDIEDVMRNGGKGDLENGFYTNNRKNRRSAVARNSELLNHPGMKSMGAAQFKKHIKEMEKEVAMDLEKRPKHLRTFFGVNLQDEVHQRLKKEFVEEIRHLARLRHPCITTVMGAVIPSAKDDPMLVMEYMRHGSLFDVLQDDTIVLKPDQILAILQDVAQGLRFLHSAKPQVIHGDLKAQNVLIDTNFCAKVTDFGLSAKKHIGAVGTPYWMAPELITGETGNTAASDVYAYGMVVYEIYSGRAPYEGENYENVMKQIADFQRRKRPPIPLHCPPKIARLMNDCLMHDPIERPTAEQLDLVLKVELKVNERTSRLEALNKDLEEANHKIASASAMQLQHFACMSHEIRTPLNCIIGLSSLLEETDLNNMQRESMEMIISSGKLLRQIVDDVLDYSKLESGNAEVLIKDINLQETLSAVVHLIKTSRDTVEKNLNIKTIYDPYLPEIVSTDSRRIQQILYNLLGNAIKFSNEDGLVEFGVHVVDNGILSFTVKDYGKGIEECDYGKIFEPFRQTETGLTNTSGGTGLGLAITKKLVQAMGGTIDVESSYCNWTQFTVQFPFTNRRVDMDALSAKLKTTTVFFVASDKVENTRRVEETFEQFMVEYAHFNSMNELYKVIGTEGALTEEATYICLVHEDLYDSDIYNALSRKARSCLVTFGPNFLVEKCRTHYRSLVETFPSVLIHYLGVFAQEISRYAAKTIAEGEASKKSEFAEMRILVAEDNLVNQKVLTRILNRLGVTSITIVGNGEDAVAREAQEEFDLILMDMQMPKMDGITACKEINKRVPSQNGAKSHPLGKIVFVTAHVSDTFRQTCLENGAVGYLPKPMTKNGVQEVLQHALGRGSMFSPMYKESWNQHTSPPMSPIANRR